MFSLWCCCCCCLFFFLNFANREPKCLCVRNRLYINVRLISIDNLPKQKKIDQKKTRKTTKNKPIIKTKWHSVSGRKRDITQSPYCKWSPRLFIKLTRDWRKKATANTLCDGGKWKHVTRKRVNHENVISLGFIWPSVWLLRCGNSIKTICSKISKNSILIYDGIDKLTVLIRNSK